MKVIVVGERKIVGVQSKGTAWSWGTHMEHSGRGTLGWEGELEEKREKLEEESQKNLNWGA